MDSEKFHFPGPGQGDPKVDLKWIQRGPEMDPLLAQKVTKMGSLSGPKGAPILTDRIERVGLLVFPVLVCGWIQHLLGLDNVLLE